MVRDQPGGFATHITADERFVFKVPAMLESAEASPLFCSGLTVYSAIKKAAVEKGMAIGVVGIGGLGHLAVQILHYMGAEVLAFSNKASNVNELGATKVMPYQSDEARQKSLDRLFVTTPAPLRYDFYLNLLKPTGELWILGSDTHKTTFSSWLLNDLANRSIRGSYIGSPAEMRELLKLATAHHIQGHTKVLPMAQLGEALRLVESGSDAFRIIVNNRP